MMDRERYLTGHVIEDLSEKMVFIGGARQVGKTFLATRLVAPHFQETAYFNWDNRVDRKRLINSELPGSAELIILDEIHKYKKWKTLVKGEYDKHKDRFKFLVTGSARLDIFRRGGDSLQGRYHYYRLHPFTLAELLGRANVPEVFSEIEIRREHCFRELELLDRFGGFPEMLVKQSDRALRRWHNERIESVFREDIRNLHLIKDVASMKLLSDLLPGRVGSLLSANSLRHDLEVSHRAVSNWLDILEQLYYHFRLYPFNRRTIRSIRKEPKLFLFDWSEIDDEGARFENMIGSHLLKLVHFLHDREGHRAELNFLRNVDKKEVDFLVSVNKKPWFCVETKLSSESIDKSLGYFRERLDIPFAYQVIKKKGVDRLKGGTRLISADRFLSSLI